jgi:TatD DNase family protein
VPLIDTHCHLGYDAGADAAALVRRAQEAGVLQLLDVGIDLDSSTRARAAARALPGVHWSAGLHPNDSGGLDAQWSGLELLMREPDCVAIGETGLDWFRDHATPAAQRRSLERHLQAALQLGKPVILHCRDAFDALYEVLVSQPGLRGVMHCFTGGPAEAEQALALGLYLSFAGPLTYPKSDALREAARLAPADRILLETDAPFLPPQGRRGQRNEPAWIVATAGRLAELRGCSLDEIGRQTTANARALFRI